ncbi:hypothetical protein GCM10009841_04620 [Microlunatus panaciterrae]|uniref:MinD-like ATPase involved in chromosome partitioning or flagellar assembly n=1 Tax=Microlunatus panaciterrae TaxID=400768 RepID=A0ABS2RIQ0_9ACTN|nr:hypothetical protein [Microlunatus panaciterrae]MBM7798880.1 hypothetical protein [Microlunatus panaciterrae]
MALLVMTSAAGSPGVTTLAVGLALTWPRSVLLVDADPSAQQAVLAGYFRGQSRTGKGLLRVAEAHRDGRPLREVVVDQTVPLAVEAGPRRMFLAGFTRPGSAALFSSVWTDLAETLLGLDAAEIDVIIDAGRMTAQGLPDGLLERAGKVLLVTRTSLRAIAACRLHAATLSEQCRLLGAERAAGLVLVGEGQPYSGREISGLIGLPVACSIADEPASAAHFSDGEPRSRRFGSAPLVRSLQQATHLLSKDIQHTRGPAEVVA